MKVISVHYDLINLLILLDITTNREDDYIDLLEV
jgi:hypothetical protein